MSIYRASIHFATPILLTIVLFPLTALSNPVSDITAGSPEYQHISDAIDILKEAGGDATKPPSPAWMAQNIKSYLDAGKIKNRDKGGAYGSNTTEDGPVYIHFGVINSQIVGDWNPNSDIGFKKLVILTETLAHEKYHSENHDISDRLWDISESHAYLHEIHFIDEWALALSKQCANIQSDEPGKKLRCYKRLRIIYKSKQDAIKAYNAGKYAAAGKPVPTVMVDVIDSVVEQLDMVIPRWEEYAEEAGENSVGQLRDDFDQQYGAAQVAFHRNLEKSEADFLTALNIQQHNLATSIQANRDAIIMALGDVIKSQMGLKQQDPFVVIAIIEGQPGLLTEESLYSIIIQYDKKSGIIIPLNQLKTELDVVVRLPSSVLKEIIGASDKPASALKLLMQKAFTIESFSSTNLFPAINKYLLLGLVIAVFVLLIHSRVKKRG